MVADLPRAGAGVTEAIRPELGRRYRTRDGRITFELRASDDDLYPFEGEVNGYRFTWNDKGWFFGPRPEPYDLVEVLA